MKDIIDKLKLIEAPIGDIETKGFDNTNGNFIQRDKILVTDPDKVKKIRKSFENTPYVFDLYFIDLNTKNYAREPEKSLGYDMGYENMLEKYSDRSLSPSDAKNDFAININSKSISAIYLSNLTDTDNIPLTPWMIAHRFTHSILPNPVDDGSHPDPHIGQYATNFFNSVKKFEDFATKHSQQARFTEFLTFRTARKNDLKISGRDYRGEPFYEELQEEMLTQFIINGIIKFTIPKSMRADAYDVFDILAGLFKEINKAAKQLLAACQGRAFVAP
jgi:hypothetical protein